MIIGVVGKANVGKSTFFKAATLAEVEIANYPFTTIKPNEGVAYVKVDCVEKEFNTKCKPKEGYCLDGVRFVPVKLIDVAGLVPGAHEGKGMGNQFLDDLNQADVLIHVIDISGSTNEKGEPVEKLSYDPSKDVKFLEHELDHWYLRILKKNWDVFVRKTHQEKLDVAKSIAKRMSGLKVTEEIAKEVLKGFDSDITKWKDDDVFKLASELRKKTKPIVIAANKIDISRDNLKENMIGVSSESELALKEAAKKYLIKYIPGESFEVVGEVNSEQKKALDFIKKVGNTGVQDVLDKAVFDVLDYISVFPVANSKLEDKDGNKLPDCILLKKGSCALDLAYAVHTSLGDGFIRAIDLKTKKTIGKDYVLKHGDVIEIVTKS